MAFWATGLSSRDVSQVQAALVLERLRDYGRPETQWERAAAAVGR